MATGKTDGIALGFNWKESQDGKEIAALFFITRTHNHPVIEDTLIGACLNWIEDLPADFVQNLTMKNQLIRRVTGGKRRDDDADERIASVW